MSLRKNIGSLSLLILLTLFADTVLAQSIILHKKNAEVWSRNITIRGEIKDFTASNGAIYVGEEQYPFIVEDGLFISEIVLSEGLNKIYAKIDTVVSDTLQLTLAYKLLPELFAYAQETGPAVTLHGAVIDNPLDESLSFTWLADEINPAPVTFTSPNDSVTSFSFAQSPVYGEYYFDLLAVTQSGDTAKARTYVTVDSLGVHPFNIKTDYAKWIDSAVIYEVTPYNFVNGGGDLKDIINKLPDLKRLGINTLWLQPIYPSYGGGQGYDVTNYFAVRSQYGTEADLRNLIVQARQNGIRVLMDFVPNHTSINHPYAKNSTLYQQDSHYWDYYQREKDAAPYSMHYHNYGGFINYFWNDLPNLNYSNPEVQNWMTKAAQYWIKNFDIDGYRFDAVWGVTARNPQFTKDLRFNLKRIKPEILLLAEDKASRTSPFEERFDAAYDWTPEEDWVSHWAFQADYDENGNPTIFNFTPENDRGEALRNALTNNGQGFAPNAKILRFIGNNDIYHFIQHHGLARTKMAAALIFTLHGIPLIYNGQETGKSGFPYEMEFVYYPGRPMDYSDPNKLFPYYQRLIEIRKDFPALISDNFEEIAVSPNASMFAYRRWEGGSNIFTILNMKGSAQSASATLPVEQLNLAGDKTFYLTELLTGEVIAGTPEILAQMNTEMPAYSAKVFALADSAIEVIGIEDGPLADNNMPQKFDLKQNYPNPFNPSTTIKFDLPDDGAVSLKVFNVLGEEVIQLVNGELPRGKHTVMFSAGNLSSGIYFYRLEHNGMMQMKKMILIK